MKWFYIGILTAMLIWLLIEVGGCRTMQGIGQDVTWIGRQAERSVVEYK